MNRVGERLDLLLCKQVEPFIVASWARCAALASRSVCAFCLTLEGSAKSSCLGLKALAVLWYNRSGLVF
ncbi:hypothetical protein SELSPUOL_01215 [Selenomonas sputigena ATCC 35185]|uniref:Uncharacterized protein n=1 Tax=Selenomonas sputigena (strain ATCC 35185 / DSM 20758 / CCUG 44933 / VPI D19B-28) TaxID=546271 RepID=C9LUS8_SELS3|nr:hypothetical protein SELSPUOL_01215 [Selenomonas sputigena ATCC 35185]